MGDLREFDLKVRRARRLHFGVQIAWFVLVAMLGAWVALADSECGADSWCLFEDDPRGWAVFVLVVGAAVWLGGAILIALFAWAMRAARRQEQRAAAMAEGAE